MSCSCAQRAASYDAVRRTCMVLAKGAAMCAAGTERMRCGLRVLTCRRIRVRRAAEAAVRLAADAAVLSTCWWVRTRGDANAAFALTLHCRGCDAADLLMNQNARSGGSCCRCCGAAEVLRRCLAAGGGAAAL
jgi:hypothetical protein